jgi:hypothetical protein
MNIRCSFCQTPYTLSRVAMLDALQEVDSKKLSHYDAHCPRCRRATQIPRQRLEMAMPNWRDQLKEFEAEMKEHPQHEAPLPKAESTPVTEAAPASVAAKEGASKPKPSAVPAESKPKTATRQTTPSAETKKSTERKTKTKNASKKTK